MSVCNMRQESLKAYLDGEVSLSQSFALRLHLLRCESCQEEIAEMQRLSLQLKNADSPLPSALRDRILNSVSYQDDKPAVALAKPVFRMKPMLAWGGAVASLLIAIGLGSKFLSSPQVKSDSALPSNNSKNIAAPSAASPDMNRTFTKVPMGNDRSANKFDNAPSVKPLEESDKKGSAYYLATPAAKSASMDVKAAKSMRANPESKSAPSQPPLQMRSMIHEVNGSEGERQSQSDASGLKTKSGMEDRKQEVTAIAPLPSSTQEETTKQTKISPATPANSVKSKAFNTPDLTKRPIAKSRLETMSTSSGKKFKSVKRVVRKKKSHKKARTEHKKNN